MWGDMFLLRELSEYVTISGKTNFHGFPYFKQERTKLIKAIYPSDLGHYVKSAPGGIKSKLFS